MQDALVAVWQSVIMRACVQNSPAAIVYQRQLSLPSLLGQLMSTSENWGVNGHTLAPDPWSCSFDWRPADG